MSEYPRSAEPRRAIPWALAAMPAYTVGVLAPVPFVFVAARLQIRRLWLIAAAYGAVWVTTCVLLAVSPDHSAQSTLAGFLLIALAAVGTAHAFALSASLSTSQTQSGRLEQQQFGLPAAAVARDPKRITVAQLRAALSALKSYLRTHAEAFPPACEQLLEEIITQLDEVVSFVARDGHADAELRSVEAMLTDYLPTSINTYVRLPRDYALTERNAAGRTAADELEVQLKLLRDSATEATDSLYRGDALRLQEQSAFLRSKFGKSELDLS